MSNKCSLLIGILATRKFLSIGTQKLLSIGTLIFIMWYYHLKTLEAIKVQNDCAFINNVHFGQLKSFKQYINQDWLKGQ